MTSSFKLLPILLGMAFALTALPAIAQSTIDYVERVNLKVGQSAIIYGYRGDCGKKPTASQVALPATNTGTLSLGKIGVTNSNRCGGRTPAFEIIFTATKPGRESFELNGDKISVRVK